MSDAYAYANNGPIEPFWQRNRINRFFLLPLDKAVLTRIAGLSARLRSCPLRCCSSAASACCCWCVALLAILVTGVRYGFKIIERSSKGFLRPSDYPLTDDDLVSEYLPYKYAAMNLVFGVLATLLELHERRQRIHRDRCLAVFLRRDQFLRRRCVWSLRAACVVR